MVYERKKDPAKVRIKLEKTVQGMKKLDKRLWIEHEAQIASKTQKKEGLQLKVEIGHQRLIPRRGIAILHHGTNLLRKRTGGTGPQGQKATLRLLALRGPYRYLALKEESSEGCFRLQFTTTVGRNDETHHPTLGQQAAASTTEVAKGETVGLAGHSACAPLGSKGMGEEGRVDNNGIKGQGLVLLQGYMRHLDAIGERTYCYVFLGLLGCRRIEFDSRDLGIREALRHHQSDDTRACPDIEDALTALGPRTEKDTVRTNLHGTTVLSYGELLEREHDVDLLQVQLP